MKIKTFIIFAFIFLITITFSYSDFISNIYIDKHGKLNAIEIDSLVKYNGKIYVNRYGKIISIYISFPDIDLYISGKGKIQYYRIKNFANAEFIPTTDKLKKVRYLEFKYDYNYTLKSIGYLRFKYDNLRYITNIGNLTIKYDFNKRVKEIGYINFYYNPNRLIRKVGNFTFYYTNLNSISAINYLKFYYKNSLFNKIMGPIGEKINIIVENTSYNDNYYRYIKN